MSIEIVVQPEFSRRVVRAELRAVAARALRAERAPLARDLTIAIVSDRTMRQLNAGFHGVNAPTDVLAFAAEQEDYYGDIVISCETARSNARVARWRTREELELLVVHGILHLLGYEDQDPQERARMWKRQERILRRKIKE